MLVFTDYILKLLTHFFSMSIFAFPLRGMSFANIFANIRFAFVSIYKYTCFVTPSELSYLITVTICTHVTISLLHLDSND